MSVELVESEKNKLDELVAKLQYFKEKLEDINYTHDQQKYMEIMKEFSVYRRSIKDEELCEIFFHSKYYKEFRDFFQEKAAYYRRALEAGESISIISKGAYKHIGFENIVQEGFLKEKYLGKNNYFNGVDLSQKKKIVCVGCGSMPETMIYLYENFKTKEIVGIDNNFEAVYIANQLVSHLGITNINIIHSDGVTYDYVGADFVYIAALVAPKDKVIARITETTDDDVEIIAVVPRFLNSLVHDTVSMQKHPRLKMKELYAEGETFGSTKKSILLTKYKY